jgi:uncharacterized protein (DUF1778 family)
MPRNAVHAVRVQTRLSPHGLGSVRRAAEIQGLSVSDFVAIAARDGAHIVIENTHTIRLSLHYQERFAKALINPPTPGPAWRDAMEAHRRLIKQSE